MSGSIAVLTVEDDDDDADLLAFSLAQTKERDYEIRRVRSVAELLDYGQRAAPDVILLDLHLPDSRGIETVLRAVAGVPHVPIIVLTGAGGDEIGLQAVEAGAQDYVPKLEILSPLLSRAIDFAIRRRQIERASEQRTITDPVTGLTNRSGFAQQLDAAIARAERHGSGFALAFIDLDGFKAINDTYGHAAGDEVLVVIGARCRELSRANDSLCRLGGDEFVILLDGVIDHDHACSAAERYSRAIEMPIKLQAAADTRVCVGASLGLALWSLDGVTADALLSVADTRMYASKVGRKRHRRAGYAR